MNDPRSFTEDLRCHADAGAAIGKRVGEHVYVHISAISALPEIWQSIIRVACELSSTNPTVDFNVVRIHQVGDDLSLLNYPAFFDDAFPTLTQSWRISISRKTVAYRTYIESRNPPILHRKELLLLPTDPRVAEFSSITAAAQEIGLFGEPTKIGFREQWYELIAARGYELVGSEFLPVANAVPRLPDAASTSDAVQRHLTALARYNFSAPVQALCRHGLLSPENTFFDYGCGRGDDVRGLVANGIDATGWDPHFAADADKRIADVVNLGFVINVIEDMDERIEALRGAYLHTRGVLAVAAMLSSQVAPEGRPFRDGYLTSRKTFQKYFTQAHPMRRSRLSLNAFPNKQRLVESEGGAVYKAERNGKFYVITNEVGTRGLLSPEDQQGLRSSTAYEFGSAAERNEYIEQRGWVTPAQRAIKTARWARIMAKWLITHSSKAGVKWRLVEFGGKTGAESYGIVDLIAIRKNHKEKPRGDLFDLILIQVKGGGASLPSVADIDRLIKVQRYHRAKAVVLAEWKRGETLSLRLLTGRTWKTMESPSKIFE